MHHLRLTRRFNWFHCAAIKILHFLLQNHCLKCLLLRYPYSRLGFSLFLVIGTKKNTKNVFHKLSSLVKVYQMYDFQRYSFAQIIAMPAIAIFDMNWIAEWIREIYSHVTFWSSAWWIFLRTNRVAFRALESVMTPSTPFSPKQGPASTCPERFSSI